MTEAEHTPGPWEVGEGTKYFYVQIPGALSSTIRVPKDAKANAHFIAAAPDMEKALEMYIQAEDSDPTFVEQFIWAGEAARAALAKARGEMMPESTPGPWRESSTRMLDILQVTDPGCCGERRLDEDGCCVACGRDFFDPDTGEEVGDGTRVPNARLRDAAFDLLDALDGVVRLTKVQHVLEKWELGSLKTIIAKARGG